MFVIEYLQSDRAAYLVVASVLGLVVGSFLNVVIFRLPEMMRRAWEADYASLAGDATPQTSPERYDLWSPRSTCPSCKHSIRAVENVPVLSYIWLRGRCAACGSRISLRYPGVELLTGILTLAVAWRFGVTVQAGGAMLLCWSLVALTFIDFDHQLLPDDITLPFLWLGLALNYFSVYCSLHDAVLGAIFGYGVLWTVYQLFRLVTGKEGMGAGDFKLLGMLGAWQGWQMLPAIVLLSSLVGAVVGIALIALRSQDRSVPIPFGPYLAAAGLITLFYGDAINSAYLRWGAA